MKYSKVGGKGAGSGATNAWLCHDHHEALLNFARCVANDRNQILNGPMHGCQSFSTAVQQPALGMHLIHNAQVMLHLRLAVLELKPDIIKASYGMSHDMRTISFALLLSS